MSFTNGARRPDGREPKIGRFGAQLSGPSPRGGVSSTGTPPHTRQQHHPDKRCSAIKAKGKKAQFTLLTQRRMPAAGTQNRKLPHYSACTKNAVRAQRTGSPGATLNSRKAVNSAARHAAFLLKSPHVLTTAHASTTPPKSCSQRRQQEHSCRLLGDVQSRFT